MRPGTNLWRRWVIAFTLGELIGFGLIPAVGGLVAWKITGDLDARLRPAVLWLVATVGGLGEGAVLASFQFRALRPALPGLARTPWIRNTAVAASIAWALGMLTPTLSDWVAVPVPVQIALWTLAGPFIVASIGWAQARALRGALDRPGRWVWANALGWTAGLPWTFVLPALMPEDAPLWAWLGCFGVAGTLMGATAGAITGAYLVRWIPADSDR